MEPFQRQAQAQGLEAPEDNKNHDPKYQTLPYNTKFGPPQQNMAMMKKIEALKQEKENNNPINDLPSPPPQLPMQRSRPDHQGNYEVNKPISSVTPVITNNVSSDSFGGTNDSSNGIDPGSTRYDFT